MSEIDDRQETCEGELGFDEREGLERYGREAAGGVRQLGKRRPGIGREINKPSKTKHSKEAHPTKYKQTAGGRNLAPL